MSEIEEYDVVSALTPISAQDISANRDVVVPAKSLGTVLMVHKENGRAEAFEVEFVLPGNATALATVQSSQISFVSRQ